MNLRWWLVAQWVGLTMAAAAIALYLQWSVAGLQFERDAETLHRTLSQRVDQHDAHLTALSALIASGEGPFEAPFKAVAANIAQFYPRIVGIDLIALSPQAAVLLSHRGLTTETPIELVARAAPPTAGRAILIAAPEIAGRYLLVKRVPVEAARHVVSLEIDARRLLEAEGARDFDQILLSTGAGEFPIHETIPTKKPSRFGTLRLQTSKVVASASQPLRIVMTRTVALPAIVPWTVIALSALAFGAGLLLLHTIHEHRMAARDALSKAEASAQEASLAHATRINAMGELSLAIAHELAQPLAALLSQSQAGLRILKSGGDDRAAIAGVLETNARLAKRAGDLLAKLRGWVSVDPPALQPVDLNRVIGDIAALNRTEFVRRGIELRLDLVEPVPVAAADPMGIEQVVQNLIANARDASPKGSSVTVATGRSGQHVAFTVTDEGPGLAPEIIGRLFEPFLTSKPHGMGLGLSVSRRLIEKFGGSIRGGNRTDGVAGALMTVELPAWLAIVPLQTDVHHGATLSDR